MNVANDESKLRLLQQSLKQAITEKNSPRIAATVEQILNITPADVGLHQLLGEVFPVLSTKEDARQQFQALVDKCPYAYSSRLVLARYHERAGDIEQAFRHYLIAVKTANLKGFWLNQLSTAPWARPFVAHAMSFIEQQRQLQVRQWLEPLQHQFGEQAMTRVRKAMLMYSGELPLVKCDHRQAPTFLYIPDLPTAPVFDRNVLPFAEQYEAAFSDIKDEMLSVLNCRSQFKPFQQDKYGDSLTAGGDWDAYFFHRHGNTYYESHQQCPKTSSALEALPLVHIKAHAPEVCFSLMTPSAHILPHRGVTNSRAVLHFGLEIPTDCRLNLCDVTEVQWQEGKIFAFDDTYLHEAWNRSCQNRVVLLADIWNPYLEQEEQLAIAQLIENIGVFGELTAAVAREDI
ncbi:aspartate beta-hydroxylase [Rheinheimera pacifica]|uniref:aspartyl/asparaginyl beta-hydroxylase domain-containing protein n=1 Tax=Rheinheimera pacifica TaxID=173990 RepID=UPI0028588B9A|nr:aspartyl/asparaginyl beta-hydroxylase domain-containing protein [Rheinheimera pacifica]MDR6981462.1 aspartate beta-hydroxylase [Rheinheimera pacifica]